MYLAVLLKEVVVQPAQKGADAIAEERDANGRILREAAPAVEAREAVTRPEVRAVHVEEDVQTVARNLAHPTRHYEYYQLNVKPGTVTLEPVTLGDPRPAQQPRNVADLMAGGSVIHTAEL